MKPKYKAGQMLKWASIEGGIEFCKITCIRNDVYCYKVLSSPLGISYKRRIIDIDSYSFVTPYFEPKANQIWKDLCEA